jgi:hypothetical protein
MFIRSVLANAPTFAVCWLTRTSLCQSVLGAYPHQTVAINLGTYQISGHVTIGEDQALIGVGSNRGGTALFLTASGEVIFAGTSATIGKGGLQLLPVTGPGGSSVGSKTLSYGQVAAAPDSAAGCPAQHHFWKNGVHSQSIHIHRRY